jgi:hypothetical protein
MTIAQKKLVQNYIQENLPELYKDVTAPKVMKTQKNGC